ncbi:MAG: FxLYD domain-containing protein [Parcubacteria group bacterium]|jgi:hypothetical protein
MEKTQQKRLIIIGIYVLIFLLVIYGFYSKFKPQPSCFDGKQNQNEQGVDCGGVCAQKCAIVAEKNLVVEQASFVASGVGNNFDLFAVVTNPNQTLGSSKFNYQFTVKNAAGETMGTQSGSSFILPGETKYVVESNLSLRDVPVKVELSITNPEWVEANEFYEKPQLKVVNKNYAPISNGVGFSEATGLLKNESSLSFATIKVEIILKNAQGEVVALNSTQMNTVQTGENRDFRVFWPNRFPGEVANMEVQSEVNVFASDAFVKKNFKPAKFQESN